jgi:hypothetical protein
MLVSDEEINVSLTNYEQKIVVESKTELVNIASSKRLFIENEVEKNETTVLAKNEITVLATMFIKEDVDKIEIYQE